MEINIDALRRHYENLPDEDIERLAYYETNDLVPEAVDILKNEIRRRGLSNSFESAVESHLTGLGEEEKQELLKRISSFPCPLCGGHRPLNASNVVSVKSYIVATSVEKPLIIACPNCIRTNAKGALITSLIFGWWGIPWGPIRTLWSIVDNVMALNQKKYNELTFEFKEYFEPHLIAIKVNLDEIKDLNDVLKIVNT